MNSGGEVKLVKSGLNRLAKNLRTNQTVAEQLLWKYLKSEQLADTKCCRQQPIGNYIVDFVSLDHQLIIELMAVNTLGIKKPIRNEMTGLLDWVLNY